MTPPKKPPVKVCWQVTLDESLPDDAAYVVCYGTLKLVSGIAGQFGLRGPLAQKTTAYRCEKCGHLDWYVADSG